MKYRNVDISVSLTDEMKASIDLFQYRASELIDNFEDIKNKGLDVDGLLNFSFEGGKISGAGMNVCRHRLKGLFVDFRFFVGNDEPTNFLRFHGSIGRLSDDQGFRSTLRELKVGWKEKGMFDGWCDIPALEMIKIYFNAQAFHGEHIKEKDFLNLIQSYDMKTLEFVLAMHISDRVQSIRHLRWVLERVNDKGYLQIPEYRYE
ncbi:hypothetical protein AB4116_18010 [Vibrio splendidus]|uniref:hypothetical protein n=2 Tax=Vibrio TaxID=662 RepID=UPI000312D058|nr:hypothetical protein [Vibrio splendidus]OEF33820.1 hypothetical protein A150_19175 [Vibrio splendidus 1S-124]PTQ21855.1 hypothetical protein CWO14_01940 [Vibrio splendidus]